MQDQVFPSLWLQASSQSRARLAEAFCLKRSGSAEVATGPNGHVLVSDGYTPADLMALTKERMAEFCGLSSQLTAYELFTACVSAAEGAPAEANPNADSKPFCDKCDSRGVKHKKDCPNSK